MIAYSVVINMINNTLVLSDTTMDGAINCILSIGGIGEGMSFDVDESALDCGNFYINKTAYVYELEDGYQSFNDGKLLFEGMISKEPNLFDGVLSFELLQPQVKDIYLPTFGYINNKMIPEIFGIVPDVELIPNNIPYVTELAQDADFNDLSLRVRDATGLPDSGIVIIDGKEFNYTSKTDNLLFIGIDVNDVIREGTSVAQKGKAEYIAAGHAIEGMDNIKLDGAITLLGQKDLQNAKVIFDTIPTVSRAKGIENIIAEFDEVDASNNAQDAINSIRAVTNTYDQDGTTLSFSTGTLEFTRNGIVDFPAPPDDKIINGTYTFQISVNHNNNEGDAEVRIGTQIVWVLRSGNVTYNPGTITFFNQEITNQMIVNIQRNVIPESIDVTISYSNRIIQVGNLDSSLYALLASGRNLVVNQKTDMAVRGRITKARIAIEWFATDEFRGVSNVIFDGATLGQLSQDNVDSGTQSYSISTDTISSGTATLASSDVSGISSSPAIKSDLTEAVEQTSIISYTLMQITTSGAALNSPLNMRFALPQGVKAGTYTFTVTFTRSSSDISPFSSDFTVDGVRKTISGSYSGTVTWSIYLSEGETSVYLWHGIQGAPTGTTWPSTNIQPSVHATASSIRVSLIIRPTLATLGISGGGYSGTPRVTDTNAPNAGVDVRTRINGSSSSFTITAPAPPRTIINYFDVPFREWSDFTDKQLKITYSTSYGEKLGIARCVIAIDYDVNIQVPVQKVSATITGLSGNPADIIKTLTDLSGQKIDQSDYQDLKELTEFKKYIFGRVIDTKTDVLSLLSYVLNQSMVYYYNGKFRYWFTNDRNVTNISESDCLNPILYTWHNDVYTSVNLKYKFVNGDFVKSISANASNNSVCKITEEILLERREIDLEGKWIQDDDTAEMYLENYVNRFCNMRRIISLELPYIYDFLSVNCVLGLDDCIYKIIGITSDDGWLTIQAEELK